MNKAIGKSIAFYMLEANTVIYCSYLLLYLLQQQHSVFHFQPTCKSTNAAIIYKHLLKKYSI